MINFFKKRKSGRDKEKEPKFIDVDGNPLKEGDMVESLRYEMGKCRILSTEDGYLYESLENGKQMNWLKMVDASTNFQKVKKIDT